MAKSKINLVGRTFTVVAQSPHRLILEEDNMGDPSGHVVVLEAKSIEGAFHGVIHLTETS